MKKRMAIMLVAASVLFGAIFGFQAFKAHMIKQALTTRGAPPQTVSTVEAKFTEWQPRFDAVGTLRAAEGADLAPEIAGVVAHIYFDSGETVERGQRLLQLNAAQDVARLASLRATEELDEKTLQRAQEQLKFHTVSQATVDQAAASLKSARAQVAEQQAIVDLKTIRAPFAGKLGIREVDLGQYLAAGTTIVTLQALDPIFVDFYLPQSLLPDIAVGDRVTVRSDAAPGKSFTGEIVAIDPKVDPATRNARARARIANPEHKLLPGTFATVRVAQGPPHRYLTLPQTAVTYNPYGSTVFVVAKRDIDGHELVAQQKFVTTGPTRGDQVAIVDGLKEGDTVVSAGELKLRNGTPVRINNAVQPPSSSNPTVPNP